MTQFTQNDIIERFRSGIANASKGTNGTGPRIGAELKFPMVSSTGRAASADDLRALWRFLGERGWEPEIDSLTGAVAGARKPGERNDSVASFETGYCKPEFSLAHVADLHVLDRQIRDLRSDLREFSAETGTLFLGYGIQPVTPPSKELLMKKARSSFWDRAMPSNNQIAPEHGDDVHLFTVNASCHVHVSLPEKDAVRAVDVLNGFSGGQIALMGNSSVWRGRIENSCKCVAEKLWDWWEPAATRSGVPPAPFADLAHYVERITALRPIYAKRDGKPVLLTDYQTFAEYYTGTHSRGRDLDGNPVDLEPSEEDLALHNSCYWYNARISRYYTVENRVCDQQPPEDLVCTAALTVGLVSALDEAVEDIQARDWDTLRRTRQDACDRGLEHDGRHREQASDLAAVMLDIAHIGLVRRGRDEAHLLDPLAARLKVGRSPADDAAELVRKGGINALVEERKL